MMLFHVLKENYNMDTEDYFVYQLVKESTSPAWLNQLVSNQNGNKTEPRVEQITKKTKCTKFSSNILVNKCNIGRVKSQEKWKEVVNS